MEEESLIIDKQEGRAGENKVIKINVGRLPSDTRIYIHAHIFKAKKPGPNLLVLGGIHGDEINGIEIVRRSIQNNVFENISSGTIIAIPLMNIYGFLNFSRDVPDGKDVNRSFPGSTSGSLASRIARTLTKKVLPFVDYALDFHTGGASRHNHPQVRYSKTDKEAFKLAKVFGAPYIIQSGMIDKSFRKSAKKMGIPAIVFEGGESVRLHGPSIEVGIDGIKRVMHHLKISKQKPEPLDYDPLIFTRTSWIRSPYSGMFEWTKCSGQEIKKGEPLGFINDVFASKTIIVTAKSDGFIIGHNNASVVNQGDALFHIANEDKLS